MQVHTHMPLLQSVHMFCSIQSRYNSFSRRVLMLLLLHIATVFLGVMWWHRFTPVDLERPSSHMLPTGRPTPECSTSCALPICAVDMFCWSAQKDPKSKRYPVMLVIPNVHSNVMACPEPPKESKNIQLLRYLYYTLWGQGKYSDVRFCCWQMTSFLKGNANCQRIIFQNQLPNVKRASIWWWKSIRVYLPPSA